MSGPVEHTSPREACGIFGIYAPGRNVAPIVFDGLYALQHRGQESAGMAVSDGTTMMVMKDMGLVTQVFNDYKIASLVGHLAIGHTRYSTTGSSSWHNAQPMYRQAGAREFAVGHNGNLTNTEELAASMGMLPGRGHERLGPDSRTGGPGARRGGRAATPAGWRSLGERPASTCCHAWRALSRSCWPTGASWSGVRDPNGFRPLCLGKLDDGWVLASETPALDITGAHFVREVEPGEVLVISADGCQSFRPWPPERVQPKLCLFEFVYLARPDSRLYGQELHAARVRMGELLAEQAPVAPTWSSGCPIPGCPRPRGTAGAAACPSATAW